MKTAGRWDPKFGAGRETASIPKEGATRIAGVATCPPAPLIDFLSPLKNIPTMTEQLITEKKQIALTQCAELYAGQNLRLQREALKTIEETAGRFVEILDEELTQKAD